MIGNRGGKPRYTASHWGTYTVDECGRGPMLKAVSFDPDPSPMGLHQLSSKITDVRIERPAIRKSWLEHGPGHATDKRGSDPFVEVNWDRATSFVASELARVRQNYGNHAIYGGSYGWASAGRFHHAQSQIHRFLNVVGGYVAHRDSYSLGAGRVLLPYIVGPIHHLFETHNTWEDLAAHCDLFITFGGVPSKNSQISQAGVGRHRVREGLRHMAGAGVEFVNISPMAGNLETSAAVDWIPIRPGADTAFMLGLAYEIHRRGQHDLDFLTRYCAGWEEFEAYLLGKTDGRPKDPDWAASISQVPAAVICNLAARMAGKRVMINVAWGLQRAHHGEQPFWMTITLAAMMGQIGLPGGGFGLGYGCENLLGTPHILLRGASVPQGENRVKDFIPVARIADMLLRPGETYQYCGVSHRYPDIKLIYWAGGNPYHHHQDLNRLQKAWIKPETIIVHEQSWTATARRADIVLPATMSHERNDIVYGTGEGVIVASRAVTAPHGEALNDYEIFSRIAAKLGIGEAFTEGRSETDWQRHLYDVMRQRWSEEGVILPQFDQFVDEGLIDLAPYDPPKEPMLADFRRDPDRNPLPTESGKIEIYCQAIAKMNLKDCKGHAAWIEPHEWLGAATSAAFPLHLISDQPERKLHSQLDASPHSTAGKMDGREVLSMNPIDAAHRNLAHGQVVEIFNERGACLAGLVIDPHVCPGVVRLSTGSWFDPCPESRLERHGNPNVLTADIPSSDLSQGCTAHTCLVDVQRAQTIVKPVPFERPEIFSGQI